MVHPTILLERFPSLLYMMMRKRRNHVSTILFVLSTNDCSLSASHPPRLWDGVEQVTVALGASVTLHWAVSGAPDPSVVWEHEERKVMSSGRVMVKTEGGVTSLTITEVVRSDEGVYTCCALNGLGSEIRECKVMVLGKWIARNV